MCIGRATVWEDEMNLNRRILYVGVGLILLSMMVSIGFTYYTTVKSPVILRNCIEVPIPNQENIPNSQVLFELSYITNSTNKNSVVGISFPEAPEMKFSATENGYNAGFNFYQMQPTTLGTIYGRYSIRTVYVYLDSFDQEDWIGEKKLLQADLQFNDGSSITTDLGLIILYRDEFNNDVITMQSSSSSSDGTSSIHYYIDGTVKLKDIKSDTINLATDLIELKIGGEDYKEFPTEDFKNSGMLTITAKFSNMQNNKTSYDTYDIRPKLYYETQDGTLEYIRIYNIIQRRWFYGYKDVLLYLSKRGGL